MRLQAQASLALLLLLVAASSASYLELADDKSEDVKQLNAAKSKLLVARLFDFSTYKTLFNKSYSSVFEELWRQRLFWARALRALVSAAKYKTGQEKYYLAVNQMSDMTPQELQTMINDASGEIDSDAQHGASDSKALVDQGRAGNELASTVEQDLLGYVDSLHDSDLSEAELDLELANFPIEQLIDNDDKVKLDQETMKKISDDVPTISRSHKISKESNSPLTISEWQRVVFRNVNSNSVAFVPQLRRSTGLREKFKVHWRKVFSRREPLSTRVDPLPDEVFLDLRETKCFDLARFQGQCGACYAFVMTSILEWLHCVKTGKLIKFSEQYMIDCGYDNIDTLDGCNGGNPVAAANFIRNFGVELRYKWPYEMREHQCPYSEQTPLENTGYFRFPLSEGLAVHLDMVPKQLESGPLYVSLLAAPDFAEYGGGVHGFGCAPTTGRHAMTLIGHGRESGQEYWLLRNSYGPGWGEDGYYKLAKDARCIMPPRAYVYGSANLINETDYFEFNELRDEELVKRHYSSITGRE